MNLRLHFHCRSANSSGLGRGSNHLETNLANMHLMKHFKALVVGFHRNNQKRGRRNIFAVKEQNTFFFDQIWVISLSTTLQLIQNRSIIPFGHDPVFLKVIYEHHSMWILENHSLGFSSRWYRFRLLWRAFPCSYPLFSLLFHHWCVMVNLCFTNYYKTSNENRVIAFKEGKIKHYWEMFNLWRFCSTFNKRGSHRAESFSYPIV